MNRTEKKWLSLVGAILLAVGIVSFVLAVDLWIIDSSTHYISVSPVEAYIQYSLNNGDWVNVTATTANAPWYARLRINYVGAPMQIRVTWELWDSPGAWSAPLSFETVFTLNAGWNDIYVASLGDSLSNYNWGQLTNPSSEFAYRVRARIAEV